MSNSERDSGHLEQRNKAKVHVVTTAEPLSMHPDTYPSRTQTGNSFSLYRIIRLMQLIFSELNLGCHNICQGYAWDNNNYCLVFISFGL